MPQDSVDKVIGSYFTSVNAVPFTYKGKTHPVPRLRVSPLLFRSATCPEGCGGCCGPYTLDYIPTENPPEGFAEERIIKFDGKEIPIRTISQPADLTMPQNKCRFLNLENGRCGIHKQHAFSCDFELVRFIKREPSEKQSYPSANLTSQPYGRGWAMKQVGGGVGNLCEMIPANLETGLDALRKLKRLKEWTDHFGLETRLPKILEWVEDNYRNPESAKALIFLSGEAIEQRNQQGDNIDAYYCYEEPYVYTEENKPQMNTALGMPAFPTETEWWSRSEVEKV